MGPYSHIFVASELETYINPDDSQEYFWGAIAPDIRYLVDGMRRSQTHISSEMILEYIGQYPQLKSFLQGYLVHCITDEIDLPQIIQQKFPFYLLKKELSTQQCSVILELFNIEREKPIRKSLSGRYNPILNELGISEKQVAIFAQEINQYITSPSFAALITLFQNLGLTSDGRTEKYRAAGLRFQRKWFQRNLIFFGLQAGKANKEIISKVKSLLPRV